MSILSRDTVEPKPKYQIDFTDPAFLEEYKKNVGCQRWRLDNLYSIVNEEGIEVPFKMRPSQRLFYLTMWYFNIVPKSRQHGVTSLICILFLDYCMWNSNTHAIFISYNKDETKETFHDKIRFPYDHLPFFIKEANPAVKDAATGLRFKNGSSIRVTQSGRGGTYQLVHISEYGDLCKKWPMKAKEIKTGTLNAVHPGQMIVIESTMEGREGDFFTMCESARKMKEMAKKLTKLDFKFHFLPWYNNALNNLEVDNDHPLVVYDYQKEYFNETEGKCNIKLTDTQKAWYIAKWNVQGDDMRQQHPRSYEEAVATSIQGAYYTNEFTQIRKDGRITKVPFHEVARVDTWWDLGVDAYTVIWLTQDIGREVHVIGCYINSGEGFKHFYDYLDDLTKTRKYRYGVHVAPHDVVARDKFRAESYLAAARKMGFSFQIAPKLSIFSGIQAVRRLLAISWFDQEACGEGITGLENYRKQWNEQLGCYRDHALEDHPTIDIADAFRTMATAHQFTTAYALGMNAQQQRQRQEEKKDPRGWT